MGQEPLTSHSFPDGLPPLRSEAEVREMREAAEKSASERRYCTACRYCRVSRTAVRFSHCAHPDAPTMTTADPRPVDPAIELSEEDMAYASITRGNALQCGPNARWFEAKQVAA